MKLSGLGNGRDGRVGVASDHYSVDSVCRGRSLFWRMLKVELFYNPGHIDDGLISGFWVNPFLTKRSLHLITWHSQRRIQKTTKLFIRDRDTIRRGGIWSKAHLPTIEWSIVDGICRLQGQ